ncbi:class I SAM-dependent methyltransferase [Caulobacter sp. BE254]|uniref:O-methyltransferase n=1 Tax=Caulobacter sp. BE254 TaxID=2817720 RepID=UPI002861E1F6|nr:class I SAM-dependent methyltransferase [Caulobacter sp. BE254]MDR7117867.1 putative O-methyltransferase YrrM [Caulobacter sp. BE254]
MFDDNTATTPATWREIDARSRVLGFDMPSEAGTGAMLRLLAATKAGGRFLELGTGTGLATAWLLDGMAPDASLVSIDTDMGVQAVARAVLAGDPRVTFVIEDGLDYVRAQRPASFDLIFADAWPGKYEGLDETLALLGPGGLYVVDDMSPQPNWPPGHQPRVDALVTRLKSHPDLATVALDWASGLVIAARRP